MAEPGEKPEEIEVVQNDDPPVEGEEQAGTDLDAPQAEKRPTKGSSTAGALGPVELLRFCWRQLTSMRTALALLFIGALAAIPGGLIPQRPTAPIQVRQFITEHPKLGPVYDKLGLFAVYTSPWFSAIYLLLLISLVGCIVPRVLVYARAARAEPVRTPRHLSRLPISTEVELPAGAGGVAEAEGAAEAYLRGKRYRIRREEDRGGLSLSAEKGYLREAGNLIFHISLVFVLVGVAIGVLFGYRGTATIPVGQGFANNLTQYDEITSGAWFTDRDLTPFAVQVTDFKVRFETGRVNTGQPREFTATTEVTDSPGSPPHRQVVEVNHPLKVNGAQIHLLGHGYAPVVTVRDGQGNVAWSGPVTFLPQDGNFTSAGVIKAPDARPDRLAFEGIFVPTAPVNQAMPRSLFPDAYNPALYLNAWFGPPRAETGEPENIYSLDKTGMTQLTQASGDILRARLAPGQTWQLPDNHGSITYEGTDRWVKLQVSNTPGMPVILVSLLIGVAGLCMSLFIRPRRLWVRLHPDGRAEIAGLDRADARPGLTDEVVALAEAVLGEEVEIAGATE